MFGTAYLQGAIRNELTLTLGVILPTAVLRHFTAMNKVNVNTIPPFCSPACDPRQLSTHLLNTVGERERPRVLLPDISSALEQAADVPIHDLNSYFDPSTQTSALHLSQRFQTTFPSLPICSHCCTAVCSYFP